MGNKVKCGCPRCTLSGMTGPAVLITLGVLFLIDRAVPGLPFWRLWPVLLIAVGLVKLVAALAPATNHVES